MARGQDGMEVKKDMLHYMQDVRTVRGMGRGLSDHHVVLCKVRLVGTWIKRGEVVSKARRIRTGYTVVKVLSHIAMKQHLC